VSNDWERVSNLFGAVRLLDEPVRRAFLDVACSGNSALRRDIESLLAADAVEDDFLAAPAWSAATNADGGDSLLLPGQVLKDRYEIDAEHSSGGQSVVYLATDRVLSRRVVIKVMRTAPAYHLFLKARFEAEMHALSRIDHPAVIGIHDVGVLDDGAPFLVIQYVDGVSVRELLRNGPVDRRQIARIVRAVGAALSVIVVAFTIDVTVVPAGIPVPETGIPLNSAPVLGKFVTVVLPAVRVPREVSIRTCCPEWSISVTWQRSASGQGAP